MRESCATCKWLSEYEEACTNGDSENAAEFMEPDDYCKQWEGNYEEGADEDTSSL